MVACPADGAAPHLGVASLAVVQCCWSFSLLGTVVLGLTIGHVVESVGKLSALHHSLVAPPGCLRKLVKIIGNCGESPRSSWFVRLNCTSFCAGFLGEHTTVGFCSKCEHLVGHVRMVPGWAGLTPFPGDSLVCRCSRGQLEQ